MCCRVLGGLYSFPQCHVTGQVKGEIRVTFGDLYKHDMWLHMWRSEDNLEELALSFYRVGPGDQAQIMLICRKYLSHPGHLTKPPKVRFFVLYSSKASCLFEMDVLKV